jgi:hypothetical protein
LYELCGVVLQNVTRAKYLGITISADLQWDDQVCAVVKRANSTLHFISMTLKYCPNATMATAYTGMVRSGLEYCASVWDPYKYKAQDINTLDNVNQRAARVVHNMSRHDQNISPTNLLRELHWQDLETRQYHQHMILMYKISHNKVAVPPTRLTQPQRATR